MRKIFVLGDLNESKNLKTWAEKLSQWFSHSIECVSIDIKKDVLTEKIESEDGSMLLIGFENKKNIQPLLNLCRDLRVPYVFISPESPCVLDKISVPITFLIEDKEKIPFASAFGRFAKSELIIYQPKDYGDKARETIAQAETLFKSFSLPYYIKQGKKGSFHIEREAVDEAETEGVGMVLVSASREYGIDDIIFGSKEKKILKKSKIPVMLINPRADLYTLCD